MLYNLEEKLKNSKNRQIFLNLMEKDYENYKLDPWEPEKTDKCPV